MTHPDNGRLMYRTGRKSAHNVYRNAGTGDPIDDVQVAAVFDAAFGPFVAEALNLLQASRDTAERRHA